MVKRILLILILLMSGCATKAGASKGVGFVQADLLQKRPNLPFHGVWYKLETDWSKYTKLQIAPVNTSYLKRMGWWKQLGRSAHLEEDAKELARYAEETLKKAFREDPNHRFELVESPGPNTLIGEFAIVEIVPSKVILNTMGYAPFVGSAVKLVKNTTTKSTVAFEARVRDAETGEIVAMFADRESEKMSPVTLKDLSWSAHAKSILGEWAHQFVQVANKKEGEAVKDSNFFDLKPW